MSVTWNRRISPSFVNVKIQLDKRLTVALEINNNQLSYNERIPEVKGIVNQAILPMVSIWINDKYDWTNWRLIINGRVSGN